MKKIFLAVLIIFAMTSSYACVSSAESDAKESAEKSAAQAEADKAAEADKVAKVETETKVEPKADVKKAEPKQVAKKKKTKPSPTPVTTPVVTPAPETTPASESTPNSEGTPSPQSSPPSASNETKTEGEPKKEGEAATGGETKTEGTAPAEVDTLLAQVLAKMQANYERINDFHAKFTQETKLKSLDQTEKKEGEVWLKKPGKMRWNFYTPGKEEIVSDGATVWSYNEAEKQVFVSPVASVMGNPSTTALLSGLENISDQFNANFSASNSEKDNVYLIDLLPKENKNDEEFNKVTIAVNKKTMFVDTVYLNDPFGNQTVVRLRDIKTNKGAADSLFKFDIPPGVDVMKPPTAASQ